MLKPEEGGAGGGGWSAAYSRANAFRHGFLSFPTFRIWNATLPTSPTPVISPMFSNTVV